MDNSVGGQTPTIASDNTDYPIPKDRYGDPITYDSNPACLAGVMHDINKWIERTGNYKLLFEQYAVPLSNGALAIDQPDNIMFIEQRLPNAEVHGFFNPCPPTNKRIAQYNIKAVSSTPRLTTATPTKDPVPKEQSQNYVASAHKVEEQLRKLMCSLAHVFVDRDAAHAIIDKCAGNGFTFLELWREESLKAKPSDLALVTTLRDAAYTRGVPGDLTFNDALKEFLKLERACPPNVRKSDAEMTAFINTAMLTNTSTRSAYEQLLMVASPPIVGFDKILDAARSMLRTRQTYSLLDQAKGGAGSSHTVSTRSRPICAHEEVGELDPVFQIDPKDAGFPRLRPCRYCTPSASRTSRPCAPS